MNYKLKSVKCCFDPEHDKHAMAKLESYGFRFGNHESCECIINQYGHIEITTLEDLITLMSDVGCPVILSVDYIMLYNQFDMHCENCRKAIGLQA